MAADVTGIGFTDRDFDAYAPKKWRSNVFNRERLEVKQKLLALGRDISGSLTAADGSPLACEASVEHPALWNHKQVEAQHLFFSRNEVSRKELDLIIDRSRPMTTMLDDPTPQRNHVFLCVTLDHERLELALRLHPDARVDRQNLERKLADSWEASRFVEDLHALGPDHHVAVTGRTSYPAAAVGPDELHGLIAELAAPEAPGRTHWLVVARSLDRAEAKAHGERIAQVARDGLRALLPLYHFIAWSRDNDFVSMREQLKHEKQARRQKGIARNDRVRIVRGVFSGRSGVVQEIDAKGALRVRVGTMAVKVGADEVEKA